jgi:ABC-2 type transport system ATP-binding protein
MDPRAVSGRSEGSARATGETLPAVEVVDLGKRFGAVEAVRGISFQVHAGEVFGLLGPNGAGKTTTLSILSTLLPHTHGAARIFGTSLADDVRAVRRLVGLVPQDLSLYPELTARENLDFFGRLYGLRAPALALRVKELLAMVGLAARADERVHTFSGGMKRRLNLAAGLVHDPRLLLLDEPTVGVDAQSRQHILEAIRLLAGQGMTVLYTTHYMEEAERLCDRIAIMDEGRIIATGTLPELLRIVGIGEVITIPGQPTAHELERLRSIPEVSQIETTDHVTRIIVTNVSRALGPIAALLAARPRATDAIEIHPVNLEQVFLRLTGKTLRD